MDLRGESRTGDRSREGGWDLTTPSFESVWPDVERRLRALLFRRGLDTASADDVVQEVALRALATGVTYASAQDLLRWAGPVACNLHVDLLRHRARLMDGEIGTEHPAPADVAGEVADRMELQRALRGIAALRPADREAIIDAVTEEATPRSRKEAVKLAVRRHRARTRLLVVLEQLAGWSGALAGLRWLRRGKRTATALAVVPAAAVVLPLVGAFVVPGLHGATHPPAVSGTAPEARRLDQTLTIRTTRTASSRSVVPSATGTSTETVTKSATSARRPQPVNGIDRMPAPPQPGIQPTDPGPGQHLVCVDGVPKLGDVCL